MPLSLYGDSTANQFAVQSQRCLRRVFVEYPFAEDLLCFVTQRKQGWECTANYSKWSRSQSRQSVSAA